MPLQASAEEDRQRACPEHLHPNHYAVNNRDSHPLFRPLAPDSRSGLPTLGSRNPVRRYPLSLSDAYGVVLPPKSLNPTSGKRPNSGLFLGSRVRTLHLVAYIR